MAVAVAVRRILCALLLASCTDAERDYGDPTAVPLAGFSVHAAVPGAYAHLSTPVFDLRLAVEGTFAPGVVGLRPLDAATAAFEPLALVASTPGTFEREVALVHGSQTFLARATDAAGRSAEVLIPLTYEGPQPGLRVDTPPAGATVLSSAMTIAGRTTAAEGARVVAVDVRLPGGAWIPAALRDEGAFDATVAWPVAVSGAAEVEVRARDDAGRTTTYTLELAIDTEAPALSVFEPTPGARIEEPEALLTVRGAVVDDTATATVWVGMAGEAPALANGTAPFAGTVRAGSGAQQIEVRAIDAAGRTQVAFVPIVAPRRLWLGLPEPAPQAPIDLTLDRPALESILPSEGTEDIVLFCLDMRGVVAAAMDALAAPAAFGMNVAAWPPLARNMAELVAMTPETARFEGTPLELVMALAEALGMPPPSLLRDLLDIQPDEAFLPKSALVDVLMERIVLTHPSLGGTPHCEAGTLGVTLADALSDMATLEASLGSKGGHPGLVSGPPHGIVLSGSTVMTVRTYSQLVGYQGVDLQAGKARFYTPPDGTWALWFAIDELFELTGLADYPRVDLGFRLTQAPGFVPGGVTQGAGGGEAFATGDSPAWALPSPWWLEGIVIDAAYRAYRARWAEDGYLRTLTYALGSLDPAATLSWSTGWLAIETAGGLGSPPAPAYLWDTLLEVAQVRLRDGVGPSADGTDVLIPLAGVPMPVTAAEVSAQVGPLLQEQQATLSDLIAGSAATRSTSVDVVVEEQGESLVLRAVDGTVAPAKVLASGGGVFYADSATSEPLGAVVPATAGTVVYMLDEGGALWALGVVAATGEGVTIDVTPMALPPAEEVP